MKSLRLFLITFLMAVGYWNLVCLGEVRQVEEIESRKQAETKRILSEFGIRPTHSGIQTYLREITNPVVDDARAIELINQLKSKRFVERVAAERSLSNLPVPPVELLRETIESGTLEQVMRAQRVFDSTAPIRLNKIRNVVIALEHLRLPGLLPELFALLEKFSTEKTIVRTTTDTILAIGTSKDIEFLIEKMSEDSDPAILKIVVRVLRQTQQQELADQFADWANDVTLPVPLRSESTLALADLGDRRSLKLLLHSMVNGESYGIRAQSFFAFRRLTGQTVNFSAHAKRQKRLKQVAKWEMWFTENEANENLNLHSTKTPWIGSKLHGHILLTQTGKDRVELRDKYMNVIWSFKCKQPKTAEIMESGNILISSYDQDYIIEVTPWMEVIRHISVEKVRSARPAENGNIIVTSLAWGELREIDPDGKVVRTIPTKGQFLDAIQMECGCILVVESIDEPGFGQNHLVVKFDVSGKRLFDLRTYIKSAPNIQILENGNFVVSVRKSVVEFDRDSCESVSQTKLDERCFDATRLNNGNLLILYFRKIGEITPGGRTIWSKSGLSYGRMRSR